MTPTRPLLRWHGGKWMLADWIISHFPRHKIYTEAFGGGASVLLRKNRAYAEIYNDLDNELNNLFQVVRDSGDALRNKLLLTPFSRQEFNLSKKICANDKIEQARRTLIRSFLGFGSNSHSRQTGFRSNSNRSGSTPAHDWYRYPDALPAIIERIRGVVIEHTDALKVIQDHDSKETLHYVDPPYVRDTRSKSSTYKHDLTDDKHIDLSSLLHSVDGYVVISGYRCDLYDSLYHDWIRIDRQAFADGAKKRVESLWLNRDPQQGLLF